MFVVFSDFNFSALYGANGAGIVRKRLGRLRFITFLAGEKKPFPFQPVALLVFWLISWTFLFWGFHVEKVFFNDFEEFKFLC